VIRNVCIHVENEQPLLCDLFDLPTQADAGLVCTNVRMMDGKRPVFIDQSASTFFFPYHVIRFLEIPPESLARHAAEGGAVPGTAGTPPPGPPQAGSDPVPGDPDSLLPVAVAPRGEAPADGELDLDIELDIDEGFLQRVRDI
jgi:hypothetical protein